jgi:prolyl-tRNA synthetase
VPIVRSGDERAIAACRDAAAVLSARGHRVKVDARDHQPGWKYGEWDVRGVPVRVELGPRDVDAGTAVVVRRDRDKGAEGQKTTIALNDLPNLLPGLLEDIQRSLYVQAAEFLHAHTLAPREREAFFTMCAERAGMIDIPWCGLADCEATVKAQTGATTRNLRPLSRPGANCVACGEPATTDAYFAQSY